MIVRLDVIELVLAVEAAKLGACESPPGSNAGPYVERVQKVTGNKKGDAWCASDVADTGTIAFAPLAPLGLKWPLPLTGGCQELADFLAHHGALVTVPQRGDLWLCWHDTLTPARFGHVGFVREIPNPHTIVVQAGNTIRPGAAGDTREGWLNWTRTEPVGLRDMFGRWTALLPALAPAS